MTAVCFIVLAISGLNITFGSSNQSNYFQHRRVAWGSAQNFERTFWPFAERRVAAKRSKPSIR